MTELTRYVLRQAVLDCATLHESGFALRFSVNVSATDLIGEGLPELVAQLLRQYRLEPSAIAVEITENSIMTDRVRSLVTLHRHRALGVHISVDDYGTGQASLSYVRDLPISKLEAGSRLPARHRFRQAQRRHHSIDHRTRACPGAADRR